VNSEGAGTRYWCRPSPHHSDIDTVAVSVPAVAWKRTVTFCFPSTNA
jgi:hypothetical protein